MMPNSISNALKSDWSDLEGEEKDTNEQSKEEEKEDWDGDLQKQKELDEQELTNNHIRTHQSSPESTTLSTSASDTEMCTPQLSKTLVEQYVNPISVTT